MGEGDVSVSPHRRGASPQLKLRRGGWGGGDSLEKPTPGAQNRWSKKLKATVVVSLLPVGSR